jgi:uncharacterized membrane protein SpoIIM required for sporulation
MIIDLENFVRQERPFWREMEDVLDRLEADAAARLTLDEARRFHYLYERASADLAKIATFSFEAETRIYLESLVARAYGEIHETRDRPHRIAPLHWFFSTFPRTFRRHFRAFQLSVAVFAAGAVLGAAALSFIPDAKAVLLPFPHLQVRPTERVRMEERGADDRLAGGKSAFSSFLMTHNTQVSIFTLAMGVTYGVGTAASLFCNGVILGAVGGDYIGDGQSKFLFGWLLPHGVIEIPAILIAGQAGFMIAGALIGWGRRLSMKARLRAVSGDLVTIIFGMAILLVWAGLVEAFLSQYHEPVMPYGVKIAFGVVELAALACLLGFSGATREGGHG